MDDFTVPCNHKKQKIFLCNSVSLADINIARKKVFSSSQKIQQDQRLCLFLSVNNPKRRRPRNTERPNKNHKLTVQYYVSKKYVGNTLLFT